MQQPKKREKHIPRLAQIMCQNKRVSNVAIFGGALSMYIIALSMYIIRLYIYIRLDETVITLVEVTVIEPV